MAFLQVTFRIEAPADEAQAVAESVLLEQTVETPAEVAERDPYVREHMMGKITKIVPVSDGAVLATMDLPTVTASLDVAQFLNVLFGNASLHERVSLESFDPPDDLLAAYPGPQFGIGGIRERLGVPVRPLTCSALKPVGLPLPKLGEICRAFAMGGIDIIKDDHYLADHPFTPFRQRVDACQEIVQEVSAQTGRTTIYCPNLSGTPDTVRRQMEYAQERGVGAVMMAPMLLGLPLFAELVRSHSEVPVLVHPSFAGSTRIRPDTLLGRLFRMLGGDAIIFANYGGRFSYSAETCAGLARAMRSSWQHIRPAFPVPAGGMTVERAPELVNFFGNDTILLVGGSLLAAGDALLERTRAFTDAVASTVPAADDQHGRTQAQDI